MCFSAEASFGLSALLLPGGAYCAHGAIRKNMALLPLALVPELFGIQQLSEGFIWLGFAQNNAGMMRIAALVFLFFAMAFWPFWVPFIARTGEPSKKKRRLFSVMSVVGLIGGLGTYLPMVLDDQPIIAEVSHHSIYYDIAISPAFAFFPMFLWLGCYVALVTAPMILSPSRSFLYFGMAFVIITLVSFIFFWFAFASVWCFFAAILSLYLCWFFRSLPTAGRG